MNDIVVIGGGIVGASAAYRLARSGASVTLVDRMDPGQATAAGAGIISPGTSARASPNLFPLIARAVKYYPNLVKQLAEDGEMETGYETVGAILVAMNDEEAAQLAGVRRVAEEHRDAGVQSIGAVTGLDAKEAQERFPPLADIRAGLHIAGSARINGRLLRDALQRAAQRHGATVIHGDARPILRGDRVTQIDVSGQRLSVESLLLAGGAWSGGLGEALGIRLPIYPQRGQILHLEMPSMDTSQWAIVLGFRSYYMLTFPAHRVVVGATREDGAGFDSRITAAGVYEITREALRMAPGLASATVHEVRVGLRPASPDGLPVLGRIPGLTNVYVASGHGPSGLQLGPYSGAVVADLIVGKPSGLDLSPFAAGRFQATPVTGW